MKKLFSMLALTCIGVVVTIHEVRAVTPTSGTATVNIRVFNADGTAVSDDFGIFVKGWGLGRHATDQTNNVWQLTIDFANASKNPDEWGVTPADEVDAIFIIPYDFPETAGEWWENKLIGHINNELLSGEQEVVPIDIRGMLDGGTYDYTYMIGASHVFEEGDEKSQFDKAGFGTLHFVYYDPLEEYDEWNMWIWDTGSDGTEIGDDLWGGSGVPFQWDYNLYYEGATGSFRSAVFNIAADAEDSVGAIVRTDGWSKQCEDDLEIDVTDIKGSGFKTVYYIAATCEVLTDYQAFMEAAFLFEIGDASALSPRAIELVFNRLVSIKDENDELIPEINTNFIIKDDSGTVIPYESVSFDTVASETDEFAIILSEANALDALNKTYTIEYEAIDLTTSTTSISMDTSPPVFIIVKDEFDIDFGDEDFKLPAFEVEDVNAKGETVTLTNRVHITSGILDTGKTGKYEIVLSVTDDWGHTTEKIITVNVGESSNTGSIILFAGIGGAVVVAVGATIFILKRKG